MDVHSSQLDVESSVFEDPPVKDKFLYYIKRQSNCSECEIWKWLRTPPKDTVVRVNTLKTTQKDAIKLIANYLNKKTGITYSVSAHDKHDEVIIIGGLDKRPVFSEGKIVVVGEMCGLSVLRGADVFSPGILSVPMDLLPGERVSVFADVTGSCLRGAKQFAGEMYFVGNGISRVSRDELFKTKEPPRGIGIEMSESLYGCPSLDERIFNGHFMLQNLPSILAVDMLNPQPNEIILDMCAAPGGKTTHIAQRMKNQGLLVAFDKSKSKINSLKSNCEEFGVEIVQAFLMDGSKSCHEDASLNDTSPLYPPETFDRILLDAPCSGLGQRPQFYNKMKMKELESFPKIQKKLFATAVKLLKVGGTLLYSTCTNNICENEEIIDWGLDTFKNLKISDPGKLNFGHPSLEPDTITFFMCKLIKSN